MAKSLVIAKNVTLSGFPGFTASSFIVESVQFSGNTVAMEEVNDMQDGDMVVTHEAGKVTLGQITITFNGQGPAIQNGGTGTATISGGGFSFSGKVMCVESGGANASAKGKTSGTMKFQILKS